MSFISCNTARAPAADCRASSAAIRITSPISRALSAISRGPLLGVADALRAIPGLLGLDALLLNLDAPAFAFRAALLSPVAKPLADLPPLLVAPPM